MFASCGSLTTKTHALVDRLGNPLVLSLMIKPDMATLKYQRNLAKYHVTTLQKQQLKDCSNQSRLITTEKESFLSKLSSILATYPG